MQLIERLNRMRLIGSRPQYDEKYWPAPELKINALKAYADCLRDRSPHKEYPPVIKEFENETLRLLKKYAEDVADWNEEFRKC